MECWPSVESAQSGEAAKTAALSAVGRGHTVCRAASALWRRTSARQSERRCDEEDGEEAKNAQHEEKVRGEENAVDYQARWDSARLLSRFFLAHRFLGLVRGGSRVFPGGPRKPPKPGGMALGGLPGAPGAPGAQVQTPKNPYFLQGPTERPSPLPDLPHAEPTAGRVRCRISGQFGS